MIAIGSLCVGFVAAVALQPGVSIDPPSPGTSSGSNVRLIELERSPIGQDGSKPLFAHAADHAPSKDEQTIAKNLLGVARRALSDRDTRAAVRELGLCIELADVPECHETLGLLLLVMGNPAARAHLLRFLELAPNSDDAEPIRRRM